jgi:hypothetical protein
MIQALPDQRRSGPSKNQPVQLLHGMLRGIAPVEGRVAATAHDQKSQESGEQLGDGSRSRRRDVSFVGRQMLLDQAGAVAKTVDAPTDIEPTAGTCTLWDRSTAP